MASNYATFTPLPPAAEAAYASLMAELKSVRERGDRRGHETLLLRAWDLIPEPKAQHDRAQSTAGALVRYYQDVGEFDRARDWLRTLRTLYARGPASDAYLDFTEATLLMDSGSYDAAFALFDALHGKYGRRPFSGHDQRYLKFFLERKKGQRKK